MPLKFRSFSDVSRYVPHVGLHDPFDQVNRMERAGLRQLLIEDVALMHRAITDVDECWGAAARIEQLIQLDRCLGQPKRRPRKHT